MEIEEVSIRNFKEIGLNELESIAKSIFAFGASYKIWIFRAPMGSGKTTFIKALCAYLDVEDHVSSPSFSLVNEYNSARLGVIYHFDFYRIKDELEALDIGAEEYFYADKLCFIEWPEKIPSLIPDVYLEINIAVNATLNSRDFTVKKHG